MLFNSYAFIFLFLPVAIGGFVLLGKLQSRNLAFAWLIASSTFFYGAWNVVNVAIIAPSILVNYLISKQLRHWVRVEHPFALPLFVLGVAANIAYLGYFKYRYFMLSMINTALGTHFAIHSLVLPLGISFITFQKIAFLADVYSGRVQEVSFVRYLLFVMFFPQLVAGPIVHYGEMMPQFERIALRPKALDFAVAITLFSLGLFKKVIIADGIAAYVNPIFDQAAAGSHVSFFWAWGGALTYTFQIYFDFSGYSDMALGLARFFGIRLPLNFNSPFKASSIIELWNRWHVTLTRFLTSYLYTPLVMFLTRRRQARGKAVLAGRRTSTGAFLALIIGPTMATMGLSGLWHGAGLQFIAWGLLHGVFLSINHTWRLLRPRFWKDQKSYARVMGPLGWLLTFSCFVVAVVFFRSDSITTAVGLLKGMSGLNGLVLPQAIGEHLGALKHYLETIGVTFEFSSGAAFVSTYLWVACLLVISLAVPNTLDLLVRYEPALGFGKAAFQGKDGARQGIDRILWKPNWQWAAVVASVSVVAAFGLTRVSAFLYWQF